MVTIRTDRLLLRRATMDDLPAIHAILSDPQGMRYWSSLPHAALLLLAKSGDLMVQCDGRSCSMTCRQT